MTTSRGCAQLLELLARDADSVEFEGPIVEARAQGLPAAEIAELEEAKRTALTVRARMAAHRKRETELEALFQTASDLAALTSVDDVLAAIVRRARTLLGRDVAYLCLNDDEAGDTYMRVTDGSVSAAFQQVRLPMGAGLGGKVAEQGVPFASTTYLVDDRVAHTSTIDEAVIEEGLVSILGVPLKLGSTVLGVLFAADRKEHAFTRDEVALLASLAAHAAVALDNARLLAETRSALNSLEQANSALRQHSRDTELAVRAHDRLAEIMLRGGGVAEVAAELSEILDGEVVVNVPAPDEPTSGEGMTSVPVAAGSDVFGEMVLVQDGAPRPAHLRVLERGAIVTALLLLFKRQVADAANRGRRELLEDLILGAGLEDAEIASRADGLEVDTAAPMVVAVCTVPRHRTDSEHAAAFLASTRHGLSARFNGSIVLLLPGDAAGMVAREISASLGRTLGGAVTAAAEMAGPLGTRAGRDLLPGAYARAQRCLETMPALGREGQGCTMADLGFVGVMLSSGDTGAEFVSATLGPVLEYDAARDTDLAKTLDAYFGSGSHAGRTAEALHVHPNTVGQRLARIATLLGDDWSEPQRSLQIQLALQLRAVWGSASSPQPSVSAVRSSR